MHRHAAMLGLACLAFSALSNPSAADMLHERCSGDVDYAACLAREGLALSQSPEGVRCDDARGTCIIFLACDDAPIPSCTGGGYAMGMELGEDGGTVYLRDPAERTTRFHLCETCADLEHEEGPLASAEIIPAGGGHVLLRIEKDEM